MSDRLLVLVRHGQSEWNLKNLFTGWKDPDLTEQGVAEAKEAGRKLKAQGLSFDVAFTSVLTRAQHTLDLMLAEIGQTGLPITKRPGAQRARLRRSVRPQQGRRAQEMGRGAGADLAPLLRRAAARRREPEGYAGAHAALLRQEILPRVLRGERTLVAAHGNSLRALIMVLEKLDAGADPQARTRDRRAGDLPAQRRLDRGIEARSGGVSLTSHGSILWTTISMQPDLSGFPAEHRLLAGDAPVIAGQRAALAERAMAGHHERDRIAVRPRRRRRATPWGF